MIITLATAALTTAKVLTAAKVLAATGPVFVAAQPLADRIRREKDQKRRRKRR